MKRRNGDRPLIFAHRGANRVAPENTLPAFQAAIDMGVDGVELDVRYSSDGRLMIFHNNDLDQSTNGSGRLSAHTFEDLRALDAGSWFDPRFAGTRIPTLDEVLDLLAGKLLVNIELKSSELNSTLGRDTVEAVRAHDMTGAVVMSSFNPFLLRLAHRAGPEIECALLTAPDLPGWMRWGGTRRWSGATALHPELVMVNEGYVARAHRAGLAVRPWTVNEEEDMRRMIALGVDALITDAPDRLKALLG